MRSALRLPLSLLTLAAVILAVAAPVAARDEVVFRGRLDGTVMVTPLDPPLASVHIEASGNATQLGRFTLEIPHLVNQAARMGSGTYVFTAANGDTLTATFTGLATLVEPGVLTTHETAVIIGGTGRFEGATGSFTADRTFYVATGVTVGTFEGTISSPGAG
ncbi:MAG TPA: hypothetical protein VF071_12090 [Candidatus Limnocylindria bacterium]